MENFNLESGSHLFKYRQRQIVFIKTDVENSLAFSSIGINKAAQQLKQPVPPLGPISIGIAQHVLFLILKTRAISTGQEHGWELGSCSDSLV